MGGLAGGLADNGGLSGSVVSVIPTADAQRMGDLGAADRQRSMTLARAAYEDSAAAQFQESWTALTNWSSGTAQQVSANKVFSAAQGANGGINHSFAVPTGGRARIVTTLNYVTGGVSGGVIIGVSSDTPGGAATAGAANTRGIYWQAGNTPQAWDKGVTTTITGPSISGSVNRTYAVTVIVDETTISVMAEESTGLGEWRAQFSRSGFAVNNIAIFNSDSRQLTGASVGPLSARMAISTMSPRSTFEGIYQTGQWTTMSDGNHARIIVPSSYDSRIPCPLAICFHGFSSDETLFSDNANGRVVANALVADGYIVLSAAYTANASAWGAQNELDAYYHAYQYVRDRYSIGPVVLYANSMGGLASLLTLAERRIPGIVAWCGTSPACNLADVYSNATFTASINTAYGIPGSGTYAVQTAGHDPVLKAGNLFRSLPALFLAATDDTTVPKSTNTDVMSALVTPYSPSVTVTATTGGHSFNFAPYTSQITAFFDSYVSA